jgi:pectate lyase
VIVDHPYVTIAGQTAPGDGIIVKGSLHIATDHVVVRHLRCRAMAGDAISVVGARHVMVDHCSASWGDDEVLSVTDGSDSVTVQWCIISEGLNHSDHGYGSLIRGRNGQRIAYHHNLYAHNAGRSPRPGNYIAHTADPVGLRFDFRNNVIYDWGGRYAGYNADSTRQSVTRMNFVANYYQPGPSSWGAMAFRESATYARGWFAENRMNGALPTDPWQLVTFRGFSAAEVAAYKLSAAIDMPSITTSDAATAFQNVLAHAGASRPGRDAVDLRIVTDVRNRTGGVIEHQTDVGGWPQLAAAPAQPDTDRDGMPDAWELAHHLDPTDRSDGVRTSHTGYTNLERYLHELARPDEPPAFERTAHR